MLEEFYFDSVELFFLMVGHTHCPIDRWFSVLAKAIDAADFIGSTLAMQELFKFASMEEHKTLSLPTVVQLHTFHDYRAWYEPVVNPNIANYQIPLRFRLERHPTWGVSYMRYMFKSPKANCANRWLPPRPTQDQDLPETESSIPLSPFVVFNGKEEVASAMGGQASSAQFSDILSSAYASNCVADQTGHAMQSMHFIRELELSALAEQIAIMEAEGMGNELTSSERARRIASSESNIKEKRKLIETEMTKDNSAKAGYIIWLKRSRAVDPLCLDKRPAVLPNPRKWQALFEASNRPPLAPPAPVAPRAEATTLPSSVPPEIDGLASTQAATPVTENATTDTARESAAAAPLAAPAPAPAPAPKKRLSPEERKSAQELQDALARFSQFKIGCENMRKAAEYMLQLSESVDVVTSNDIIEATAQFTKRVLTSQEMAFYKRCLSVEEITAETCARVAAAEAEPWRLLRLPQTEDPNDPISIRVKKIKEAHDEFALKKEASLARLLSKRGTHDISEGMAIVSMDHFTAALSTNVDDLTKAHLKTVAKALKINVMKVVSTTDKEGREIQKRKEKEKEELLDEVKTALLRAENSEISLDRILRGDGGLADSAADNAHQPDSGSGPESGGVRVEAAAAVTAPPSQVMVECAALECPYHGDVRCTECALPFCSELHAVHSGGHELQLLKDGFLRPTLRIDDHPLVASDEGHGMEVVADIEPLPAGPGESAALAGEELAAERVAVGDQVEDNSSKKRKRQGESQEDLSKARKVASQVKAILANGEVVCVREAKLYSLLDYTAYNVQFLEELAKELKLHTYILAEVSVPRPKRTTILPCLIKSALSKLT